MSEKKFAILISEEIPFGLVANTAAVLSLSLGKEHPELIGPDLVDANRNIHKGITTINIPILKTTEQRLREIRDGLRSYGSEISIVDFTNAAQTTRTYEEYAKKLIETPIDDIKYLGIAIYGEKKLVTKFTGSLPLMR